jgi:hypothetical protein
MVPGWTALMAQTVPGIMKTQPDPSEREVLAGLVERVTYHNVENGFCVLRASARGHRETVTVVGHAATISAVEWIADLSQGSRASQQIVDLGRLHIAGRISTAI